MKFHSSDSRLSRAISGQRKKTLLLALVALPVVAFQVLLSTELAIESSARVSPARNIPLIGILFTVNSTGDGNDAVVGNGLCETAPGNGQCTLRAAIQEANAQPTNDTIAFDIPASDPFCTAGNCTINLGSALPNLTDSVTISGPGADELTVRRNTGGNYSVFTVTGAQGARVVTFSGMTITNGSGTGGIQNFIFGTVNIVNCTISNNSGNGGGGINNRPAANGDTLNVTNSTISGNNSSSQGGGIYNLVGTVNVTNCTINGNTATQSSAGGGGIFNSGTMNVTNSTISGNSADRAGGISAGGTLKITNCTISGNHSFGDFGGGIGGGAEIKSTIIALNTGGSPGDFPDVLGAFNSAGFNFVGKKDGGTGFTQPTDQTGTIASPLDPRLDPAGLQNNGGPTQTIALLFGSPAIDKGTSNGLTGVLPNDQRGPGFPRTADYSSVPNAAGGDATDIGAFEGIVSKIVSITHPASNTIHLQCLGVPSVVNRIESSLDLSANSFATLSSPVADSTGAFSYDDTSAGAEKFYRLAFP